GRLFSDSPDSNLQKVLDGLAGQLDRVAEIAEGLPLELDPSLGTDSIPDWERVLGLPDGCGPAPTTLEDRRRAVLGRLLSGGLMSSAFYVGLAEALGYQIAVEEGTSAPLRFGSSRYGQRFGSEFGFFAWTVVVYDARPRRFILGSSRFGDRFTSYEDELLECAIRRAAPAHTLVSFRYTIESRPADKNPNLGGGGSGGGGTVEDCRWVIETANGPRQILTIEGRLFVLGADGVDREIPLEDAGFIVIDRDGQQRRIELECGEVAEDCYLPISTSEGTREWVSTDEMLEVATADGTRTLDATGGRVTMTAADGQGVLLQLTCGETAEDCFLSVSTPEGARQWPALEEMLEVMTAAGVRTLNAAGDRVTMIGADGQDLVLELTCGDVVEDCYTEFIARDGASTRLALAGDDLVLFDRIGNAVRLTAEPAGLPVIDRAGGSRFLPVTCN
ncbi:MAG: putative phage tail protein, partial [Planctomycetota bacterium]